MGALHALSASGRPAMLWAQGTVICSIPELLIRTLSARIVSEPSVLALDAVVRRPFLHFIPQRDDCLQRFDHGFPIIFLFGFGELLVRYQIGMFLPTVVAIDAVTPTFVDTPASPMIVVVLSQPLH